MRIAIIGAGSVGSTLGHAWLKHGEEQRVKTPAECVKDAEIVVVATPWSATQAAVKGLGSLAGKIVIDCTNPLGTGPDGLQLILGFDTSAGEQVASWAPGAFVSRASTPQARAIWPRPPNIQ
jgi:predicted dinucleotide-binding enzyme